MLSFIREVSLWTRLKSEGKPVVLYGMGDGAEKILAACQKYGIPVHGIFVSDSHFREKTFAGFPLKRLSQLEKELGDFTVLLCFAAFRKELLAQIGEIGRRHPLLAPDVPVCGEGLFDADFLAAHEEELREVHGRLADDFSRHVLENVLNFKLSGKPGYLRQAETPKEEIFRELLPLDSREDYYDLGGYDGDTVWEFLRQTGNRFSSITVLEPDPQNFRKLRKAAKAFPAGDIRLVQAASWREDGEIPFLCRGGRGSLADKAGEAWVKARSIDSLSAGRRVSFLKMDVEGAELFSIIGAEGTLRRWAPKLAVSAYHRNEDLFRLPLAVWRMRPDYRLYLRHHPYIPAWETNYYGVGGG